MHTYSTTPGQFWTDPTWLAATPTADQPGTYAEQMWVIFTYRHADDLPFGNRRAWCRYRYLSHVTDPPARWTFGTEGFQS